MTDSATLAKITARQIAEGQSLSEKDLAAIERDISARVSKLMEMPSLPLPGQTVGVPDKSVLTTALFFDRVWLPRPVSSPKLRDFAVFGATEQEAWIAVLQEMEENRLLTKQQHRLVLLSYPKFTEHMHAAEGDMSSTMASILAVERGIAAVPVYSSRSALDRGFLAGDNASLMLLIQDLEIVDEDRLELDQVLEFRSDQNSLHNLRRLRRWLSAEMVGKPISYVQDEISVRLEQYEAALKKHGVKTATGVLSDVLDEKFLLGVSGAVASAGYAIGPFWAAIAGAGLAAGRATISVVNRLMDLRDRSSLQGSEVAFVHEIKKLTK